MGRIDELIAELCPEGVEFRELGRITNILRGKRLTRNQLTSGQGFPVYHGGLEPLGYYTASNRPANTVMIINVGASAGTVGYSFVDFWSSDGSFCLEQSQLLDNRFLYFVLLGHQSTLQSKVRIAGIPTLDVIAIEKLVIPLPPLAIQREIVKVLDTFTELTAELTAELNLRKKQYKHHRDQLLSFEDGEVEWKAMREIATIKTGQSVNREMIFNNPGGFPVINSGRDPLGYIDRWNTDDDPIGITSRGAGVGSITWMDGKYFRGNLNYSATIKNKGQICVRYFYHILQVMQPAIQALCTYDGIPALNAGNLKELLIPVPPLPEQARIVAILDKFDTLTTSLTEGLPREIELRQKQYAYYRDKLLNFPAPQTA